MVLQACHADASAVNRCDRCDRCTAGKQHRGAAVELATHRDMYWPYGQLTHDFTELELKQVRIKTVCVRRRMCLLSPRAGLRVCVRVCVRAFVR